MRSKRSKDRKRPEDQADKKPSPLTCASFSGDIASKSRAHKPENNHADHVFVPMIIPCRDAGCFEAAYDISLEHCNASATLVNYVAVHMIFHHFEGNP